MTYSCHRWFGMIGGKNGGMYMLAVYNQCPAFENELFQIRLVDLTDASDLLNVYCDEKAVPLFNSDNCHGDTFCYRTIDRMREAIAYWIFEYEKGEFVRWSIIDKRKKEIIGTIELFQRNANDYFNACGLLRLDLRSDYECRQSISSILSLIISDIYDLFDCQMIATKAALAAEERKHVLKKMKFQRTDNPLIGHDGTEYYDYWVIHKNTGIED